MSSNRATRAIWSHLILNHRRFPTHLSTAVTTHPRFFSDESNPPPPPPPSSSEEKLIFFQNLMLDVEKELHRGRRLDSSQPKHRDLTEKSISTQPLKMLLEVVNKNSGYGGQRPQSYDENTDSDSEDELDFAERLDQEREAIILDKKLSHHQELLRSFAKADTIDEAHSWMKRIDKFEDTHFKLRSEYRVIGELVNRLKVAQGKDKFILQLKLNRALKIVAWKEAFDPNNPANYTVLNKEQGGPTGEAEEKDGGVEKERLMIGGEEDDSMEFNDMKEKDNALLEKLMGIDKQLEERLAELDHTFGRKGKRLEEEIRDLAEERNALTEQKRQNLVRKGFDVKLIDVNRTCKVTKGGQVVKYTALLVCGNYQGVIGYAKAKAPAVPVALQKAHEKCFQNLHYVERHEDHTIAQAVQTSIKKTKVYLWPASTRSGVKAGRTVKTILNLAGYKNVKSKVIGSHNPHNTVKAVFKALNSIETDKDVAEKFGRTVVASHLL